MKTRRPPKPPPTATFEVGRVHDLETKVALLERQVDALTRAHTGLLDALTKYDQEMRKFSEAVVRDLQNLSENDRRIATSVTTHYHHVITGTPISTY